MVYVDDADKLLRQVSLDLAEAEAERQVNNVSFWLSLNSTDDERAALAAYTRFTAPGMGGDYPKGSQWTAAMALIERMPAGVKSAYMDNRPALVQRIEAALALGEASHGR